SRSPSTAPTRRAPSARSWTSRIGSLRRERALREVLAQEHLGAEIALATRQDALVQLLRERQAVQLEAEALRTLQRDLQIFHEVPHGEAGGEITPQRARHELGERPAVGRAARDALEHAGGVEPGGARERHRLGDGEHGGGDRDLIAQLRVLTGAG